MLINDQFYTKPDIAKQCISLIEPFFEEGDSFLEPSAGLGDFYNLLPNPKLGIDIDSLLFQKQDFLTFSSKATVVIGNPPFGKNSSLAVAFFNKASEFARLIGMIFPRTFQKDSLKNRLPLNWHLKEEIILPFNSFYNNNSEYSVPTVFQIWKKEKILRNKVKLPTTHSDIQFVSSNEADVAFQRVGAAAGKISIDGLNKSPNSHYFIKANNNVIDRLKKINWDDIKYKTAGNPSIGKGELINAYTCFCSDNG